MPLIAHDRMDPAEVQRWVVMVKQNGLASTEAGAAELIGKSYDTLLDMKKRGADRTTALAMNAAILGLPPFGADTYKEPTMIRYKVAVPVTLTIEVDAHSPGDVEAVITDAFAVNKMSDPLEGLKFALPALNVQNAMVMTCVLQEDGDPLDIEELYSVVKREWK